MRRKFVKILSATFGYDIAVIQQKGCERDSRRWFSSFS
jgi:hypothetical protein